MAELGRIEKPTIESFAGKKKLYRVRSVYLPENPSEEYRGLFDKYWDDMAIQIEKIEATGKTRKIFCEHIFSAGEEALDPFARGNERIANLMRRKIGEGAARLPLETEEIYGPLLDWKNCLQVVGTREVFKQVLDFYAWLLEKRYLYILDVIKRNLAEGEAGLLIIRDEDIAKFRLTDDVEVFFITPPSYDNILKWIREEMKTGKDTEEGS